MKRSMKKVLKKEINEAKRIKNQNQRLERLDRIADVYKKLK
ncbi:hypothetical protein [Halobacillus aidingensis]|uniref:Uncharacterized protein n=1 Tax=Halobacillus aidingensis TaxID=240303 RepID=A0A1H0MGH1_HALAD|nr:hypothetical protein [Halobacillus aidingensis]SDO79523.1 hypothetical protein SAMN05421677_10831 [Halobacillus aidingensis]